VVMVNCTLAENSAKGGAGAGAGFPGSGDGGAILNQGQAILLNVTVADNSAEAAPVLHLPPQVRGGSLCIPGGKITLTNTILSASAGETNVSGAIADGGHN